jgi:hypothetical protein
MTLRDDDVRYYIDIQVPQSQTVLTSRPEIVEQGTAVRFYPSPERTLYLSAWWSENGQEPSWRDGRLHVTLTEDGHLWLNPEPIEPDKVYDEITGEVIDVDGATSVGTLRNEDGFRPARTICGRTIVAADPPVSTPDRVCSVDYFGTLIAPIAGTVSCDSDSVLRLDGANVSLRFAWANTGLGGEPQFDCTSRPARPAEEIGNVLHYVITAESHDGRLLSLGITPDGDMYSGDFLPDVGCPCRDLD